MIVEDPNTLGALAAASDPTHLTGLRFCGTVPITASSGLGTDARDIWAAVFSSEIDGYAVLILMSPSGLCLGTVTAPAESYFSSGGLRRRTVEEILSGGMNISSKATFYSVHNGA